MKINADFERRVLVHSDSMAWVDSPIAGVSRRPLDRVGAEVARATSIVRYQPGSQFSPHVHTGGEEFMVLDGVFQDEHGDFPVGSYIRNPPQSKHQPGSNEGCIIFVKLWQFSPEDRIHVRLNTQFMQPVPHKTLPGVAITPLYTDKFEDVFMLDLEPDAHVQMRAEGGLECLVIAGEISESADTLVKHSWLRIPVGDQINATASSAGAKIWIKKNHLIRVNAEINRVNQVT